MITQADILKKIEGFLRRAKMSPTRFGTEALNDGNFVFDMRKKKRTPNLETISRIESYINSEERA